LLSSDGGVSGASPEWIVGSLNLNCSHCSPDKLRFTLTLKKPPAKSVLRYALTGISTIARRTPPG